MSASAHDALGVGACGHAVVRKCGALRMAVVHWACAAQVRLGLHVCMRN